MGEMIVHAICDTDFVLCDSQSVEWRPDLSPSLTQSMVVDFFFFEIEFKL